MKNKALLLAVLSELLNNQLALSQTLNQILTEVKNLKELVVSKAKDITDLLQQMDAATNDIATEIQKLSDQIAGGVTPQEATDIQAQMNTLKERLVALGKDPNNPVPTP